MHIALYSSKKYVTCTLHCTPARSTYRGGESLRHMHVAFHPNKKHRWIFTSAHKGEVTCIHMHIALHSNKKHRCMLKCCIQRKECCIPLQPKTQTCVHICTQNKGGAVTCKLFRKVVGVSQDVLPIKISRPSLALSLWATLISLRVTPPTTKATMRFPCNMRVCHPY